MYYSNFATHKTFILYFIQNCMLQLPHNAFYRNIIILFKIKSIKNKQKQHFNIVTVTVTVKTRWRPTEKIQRRK